MSNPFKSFGRSAIAFLGVSLIGPIMLNVTAAPALATGEGWVAASDPLDEKDKNKDRDRDEDKDKDKDRDRDEDKDREKGIIHFIVSPSGVQTSIWDDGTVSLAIPLQNDGERDAANVTVKRISVPGAGFLGPNPLPITLGEMLPEDVQVLDAQFSMAQSERDSEHPIFISGTYTLGGKYHAFQVRAFFTPNPPDNTPIEATDGTSPKQTVFTATYPPAPDNPSLEHNPEFETEPALLPLGQFRNLFSEPPAATIVDEALAFAPNDQASSTGNANQAQAFALSENASNVVFTRNTPGATLNATSPGGTFPPDPSVACSLGNADFVMFSVNTTVSHSESKGGAPGTFTTVNPTSIFPQVDGGVWGDQVVIYVPRRDIYVWLLQYRPKSIASKGIKNRNRLRIAWATPQAAAADFLHAWTWVDLTSAATADSAGLGLGNDWMDYPDLSFSDKFLYVSVDHGIEAANKVYSDRRIFVRLSLDDMLNANLPVVHFQHREARGGGLVKSHFVQSSRDRMIWSALPDTSTLTVYNWSDSANSFGIPQNFKVSSWSKGDYTAPAPDGQNWMQSVVKGVLGATRTDPFGFGSAQGHFLYFAWTAARDISHGRPYPYVRVVKVDLAALSSFPVGRFPKTPVSELDIWNPSFAFAFPALTSRLDSRRDEVALSLARGGGGKYADNAVGFLGDFKVYVTTDSNTTQAVLSTIRLPAVTIPGIITLPPVVISFPTTRYGDYFDVRSSLGPLTSGINGFGYSTLGYAVKAATPGKTGLEGGWNIIPHYVQFGRQADLFPVLIP